VEWWAIVNGGQAGHTLQRWSVAGRFTADVTLGTVPTCLRLERASKRCRARSHRPRCRGGGVARASGNASHGQMRHALARQLTPLQAMHIRGPYMLRCPLPEEVLETRGQDIHMCIRNVPLTAPCCQVPCSRQQG